MIGSTGRRWKHICLAGTGLACLGAGTIFISGCSTTTVSDSRTSAKADQQVAGTKSSAAGKSTTASKAKPPAKKPAQLAKKDAAGKARVSDLEGESRVQMAARVSRNKPLADASRGNAAATAPATPTTAVANRSTQSAGQLANQRPIVRPSGPVINPQQNAATSSTSPAAVAAKSRNPAGVITQTSGDGQPRSTTASRAVTTTGGTRPVVTPRKSEWQPENGGEPVASNHERRRADRLMKRAYTMYENGYREEALRLASVAAELEYSQLAVYKRGEERPSDFVEFLLTATGKNTSSKTAEGAISTSDRPSDSTGISRSTFGAGKSATIMERATSESTRNLKSDVRPAEATGLPQAPRDLKPTAGEAPHFATSEKNNLQAAANAGQIEVPVAKRQRKAEVSVVTADGNSADAEESPKVDDSRAVVTADRVEESDEHATAPKMLVAKAPVPAPVAAVPEPEADVLIDGDASGSTPSQSTSQLTIASLIGLLTGIAGMLGLGWWRRQERRHYAGAK